MKRIAIVLLFVMVMVGITRSQADQLESLHRTWRLLLEEQAEDTDESELIGCDEDAFRDSGEISPLIICCTFRCRSSAVSEESARTALMASRVEVIEFDGVRCGGVALVLRSPAPDEA